MGIIFGIRFFVSSLFCLGGRGGGCYFIRSGVRVGSKISGKFKGRIRGKSIRILVIVWFVRRGKFNFFYKIDDILGVIDF